ncbi:MAG: vitamin K epoxide reductase family protein [Patescibacteria group bacterium]
MPNNANADKVSGTLKYLAISMLAVSFLGFIDATYLTVSRFTGASLPCTLTHACDTVTRSEYSVILGIPVVILGMAYYLSVFFGSYLYLEYRSRLYFKITAAMTVFGFLFSAWFVYVQLGILQAICQYCMLSALTSTILFIQGMWVLKTSASSQLPSATDQE